MTSLSVTNIGVLATGRPGLWDGPLGLVPEAAVIVEDGRVVYAGPARGAPSGAEHGLDAGGRCVVPGFVDSHTHPIFAGDRSDEFAARFAGQPYRPGGINETVLATRAAPPSQLRASALRLISEATAWGTTTQEIKTGYGLTPEDESLHLDIAAELSPEATFLGAHLVPQEYADDRDGYVDLLCRTMIPAAAGKARWCDVFCEAGAFSEEESREVLLAGRRAGLGLRVHANQLGHGSGVALACELGAASADHCTHLTDRDVDSLTSSSTVATLLPITDFCTRQPYPDGRALLDAGVTVALATNCNPGSSYSYSMPLAMALAVRECGLSVDEAILAATVGGAAALRRTDIGHLAPGARADLVVLDAPHPYHLVYRTGANLAWAVIKGGSPVVGAGRPPSRG